MKIIRSTDAIVVDHPVLLIFSQPGFGKTTLGYSAADPLLLDFDHGAHRAANRRDTLQIDSWADVAELNDNPAGLAPYKSVVVDTVGRCLDLMSVDIIANNPKLGRGNNLSLQGYGELKSRFRLWVAQIRALGKDVILLAHDKEANDGDVTVVRPDVTGGSYAEIMKVADLIGYGFLAGKDRILDFSPSEKWVGKNPAGWAPFKVPPVAKATTFVADVLDKAREALGSISEESARVTQQIDDWRAAVATYTTPEEINRAIPESNKLAPIAAPQAKRLLADRAKALGFTFDPKTKQFVAPVQAAPVTGDDIFAGAAFEGR